MTSEQLDHHIDQLAAITTTGTVHILRTDLIQCPGCGEILEADVTWTDGDPFPTFVEICPTCEYIITESEWMVVGEHA